MVNNNIIVFCLGLVALSCVQAIPLEKNQFAKTARSDWDIFVFAQEWPATVCSSSSYTTCAYPPNPDTWTVHGLWPSKGSSGPSECDTDAKFVEKDLKPILDDLKARWTDVFNATDPYSFWKHEWSTHGTCATEEPGLETALLYFSKGLELNLEYSLDKILSSNNILPGGTYTLNEIENALESVTGVAPIVRCATQGTNRVQEIRICFDRKFKLVACTGSSNCGSKILYEEVK